MKINYYFYFYIKLLLYGCYTKTAKSKILFDHSYADSLKHDYLLEVMLQHQNLECISLECFE